MKATASNATGPYYGIIQQGNTSNYSSVATNNTFSNNTIQNFYFYGIYNYYCNGNIINNNDISRVNANSGTAHSSTMYGIYTYYPYMTNRAASVSGNKVHDLPYNGANVAATALSTFYGVYAYYPYGTAANVFKIDGNSFTNIMTSTGTCYTFYIYYANYTDVTNNVIDNIQNSGTSATLYNFYIYYPTGIRCNGNTIKNVINNYYLYNVYIYYASNGSYAWNEFQDNVITKCTTVNYHYLYIYYYTGTNNFKINRNYVVGNRVTSSTGYFYNYFYYLSAYQFTGNVFANNYANSTYLYIYSGLSGYNAELRNNTFQVDNSNTPTPGSSYIYSYIYLYYHTVQFTGNIFDFKGATSGTLPYYLYRYWYMNYSSGGPSEFDRNVYWFTNNWQYSYWYFNGTDYSNWANFSSANANGPNDIAIDPKFIDKVNNDWRPGAFATQNNVPYLTVNTKDALKVDRNKVRHDRGGLETPTDIEAVSTNFTVPAVVCAGYTTGKTNIVVKSNYQYDKATNFNVSYSVNGGPKVSAVVKKQLALGDTAMIYFPKPLTLNAYGNNRIAIYVDMPDDYTANDSFIFNTFVKPAPGGGKLLASAKPTVAFYQYSKPNDVTVLKAPVIYNSSSPRIYSNGAYGTDWTATGYAVTTGGNPRPSSEITYTAPSGGNDLELKFQTSDASMEDSSIWVCLKVTDLNNGCDTIIRRQVLIYPTIVPKFVYPSKICDGDAVLFENKSTVRSGNMEFAWTFGTGNPKDISEQQDPQFTFPSTGTYKVKMTAITQPYGFPSYDSAMVVVGPLPKVDFVKANACEGKALSFTNKTTPANSTYNWKFGDNTSSTATNPTKTYANTGAYQVTLTASLNGCTATETQYAYQFDKPKANWAYVSGSCDNEAFTFKNNSTIKTGLFGSYWNLTGGDVSTETNPEHIFGSAGNKSIKLIVTSEFGCKDSMTRVITVKESPKVAFTHTPACSLTPTTFTNQTPTVSGAIATYKWDFGDGSTTGATSPTHNWSNLGPKTITLTVSLDNGCKSFTSKDINVLTQPKADFTAASVCSGTPVVFENSTTWAQGDVNYLWNFGDATTGTTSDPNHDYGNVTLTTTYFVTLYANITGGCSDSIRKAVTVNESPKTCDFKADPDYAFGRNAMKFQSMDGSGNVTGQGGVSYTWVIETGGNKSGSSVQHDFLKDGVYTVTMRAKVDATGCECSKTKQVVMNRSNAQDLQTVGIAVFPNPSNGNFNVALTESFGQNVSIEVLSITGTVVKTVTAANNGLVSVNAGDIADGTYLVRVSSGNKVVTRKITIGH